MTPLEQLVISAVSAGLSTLAVLISLLITNQHLSDIERRVDQRFYDLEKRTKQRFYEYRYLLDARLKHLEEHR